MVKKLVFTLLKEILGAHLKYLGYSLGMRLVTNVYKYVRHYIW